MGSFLWFSKNLLKDNAAYLNVGKLEDRILQPCDYNAITPHLKQNYNAHRRLSYVSITVHHSHREKLRILRDLDYDLIHERLPLRGMLDDVPLRYLSTVLYVNFSMLWPEAITLIESHGNSLNRDKLWKCYEELLTTASENCMSEFDVILICFIKCLKFHCFTLFFWIKQFWLWNVRANISAMNIYPHKSI